MDKSRRTSIKFLEWVAQCCIYAGDGFWLYYKRFYTAEELFDKWILVSCIEKVINPPEDNLRSQL